MVAMISHSRSAAPDPVSLGRLFLLGAASIFVYLMTLSLPYLVSFASFPLVIAIYYYKRSFGFILIFACLLTVFFLLRIFDSSWAVMLFPLYLVAVFIAVTVGEILLREIPPARAVLAAGTCLAILIFGVGGSLVHKNKEQIAKLLRESLVSIQSQVQAQKKGQSQGGGGRELKDRIQLLIDKVDQVVISMPVYIFISIFLGLWFNLYLALRGSRKLRLIKSYPYHLRHLTSIRLPYWTAYLCIGFLVLCLLPEEGVGENVQIWAENAVYILGSFFFLQGLGVYIEYLDFLKVKGIFKSILLFVIAIFAHVLLAIIGLFDLWFNFRKFFKHKSKGKTS